jgi:hypothetical protein
MEWPPSQVAILLVKRRSSVDFQNRESFQRALNVTNTKPVTARRDSDEWNFSLRFPDLDRSSGNLQISGKLARC